MDGEQIYSYLLSKIKSLWMEACWVAIVTDRNHDGCKAVMQCVQPQIVRKSTPAGGWSRIESLDALMHCGERRGDSAAAQCSGGASAGMR